MEAFQVTKFLIICLSQLFSVLLLLYDCKTHRANRKGGYHMKGYIKKLLKRINKFRFVAAVYTASVEELENTQQTLTAASALVSERITKLKEEQRNVKKSHYEG